MQMLALPGVAGTSAATAIELNSKGIAHANRLVTATLSRLFPFGKTNFVAVESRTVKLKRFLL